MFVQVKENTTTFFQPMLCHSTLFNPLCKLLSQRVTQPIFSLPTCNFDKYSVLFITCILTSYFYSINGRKSKVIKFLFTTSCLSVSFNSMLYKFSPLYDTGLFHFSFPPSSLQLSSPQITTIY